MVYSRWDCLPISCRIHLFLAITYSHVQYCIEEYFTAKKSTIDTLHIACNRALRTFQGVNRFHNVNQLYINYDILPMHLLGNLRVCTLIYRSLHYIDSNFNSICNLLQSVSQPVHNYSARLKSTNYIYKKSNKASTPLT